MERRSNLEWALAFAHPPATSETSKAVVYFGRSNAPKNFAGWQFQTMRRVPAFLLLLLISSTRTLGAPSAYALVSGGVADPSKAVIADAKVGALDIRTNSRYGGATNNSGEH